MESIGKVLVITMQVISGILYNASAMVGALEPAIERTFGLISVQHYVRRLKRAGRVAARVGVIRRWLLPSPGAPYMIATACVDARYAIHEALADLGRNRMYVIRSPGAVVRRADVDIILGLLRKISTPVVLLFTDHRGDCAAETLVNAHRGDGEYAALEQAFDEHEANVRQLLEHPLVAKRLAEHTLGVMHGHYDANTNEIRFRNGQTEGEAAISLALRSE